MSVNDGVAKAESGKKIQKQRKKSVYHVSWSNGPRDRALQCLSRSLQFGIKNSTRSSHTLP